MLYRLVRPMKRKGSRNGYFQRRISAYSDASIVDDFHHGVGDELDAKLCQPLGVEDKVDRRSACALARSRFKSTVLCSIK
jgi:hypothetical protein